MTDSPDPAPDHERIWLEPPPGGPEGRMWCQDKVWNVDENDGEPTEYVRADIHATALALIKSQRATIERVARERDRLIVERDEAGRAYVEQMLASEASQARVTALEAEMRVIEEQDLTEIALDPDWPRRIARAALSSTEVKNDG